MRDELNDDTSILTIFRAELGNEILNERLKSIDNMIENIQN